MRARRPADPDGISGATTRVNATVPEAAVDVSIVIVVYRTPDFLQRCLEAISAAAPGLSYEIHVLDNAPLDSQSEQISARWGRRAVYSGVAGDSGGGVSLALPEEDPVEQDAAQITYRRNEKNLGFGRAVNQGIESSRGRFVLVLNPDVEVTPGSIEALVEHAEAEPDIGLIAPRLHYPDGTLQLTCRTFYTLPIFLLRRTFLGKLFPHARIMRQHLMLDWDHATTRDVDWCIGGALLARQSAIDDVGKMDERFFLYFEDVDWCYRMHEHGWRVVYHPAARMTHHYQRASAGWKPSRGLFLHIASTVRFYEKWSFILYWVKLRSSFLRQAAFFFNDLLMVVLAFVLAYGIRYFAADLLTKPLFGFDRYGRFLVFSSVVAMGSFATFGHYRERFPASFLDNLFPVMRALLWTSILMMASTFLFSSRAFSRAIVVMFFPLAAIVVALGRTGLVRLVQSVKNRDLGLLRVAIVGRADAVQETMERFRRFGRFGMEPLPLPGSIDTAMLLRRLRSERVQEVLLFEDCPGDVPGFLAALRAQGMPIRLVPALRHSLPTEGVFGQFMGFPSIRLGTATVRQARTPGRRLFEFAATLLLGSVLFLPFLATVIWRRLRGRRVLEHAEMHGGFRPLVFSRLAFDVPPRNAIGQLLRHYPMLGALAAGEVAIIGTYPFSGAEWNRLGAETRASVPLALPGLVGPWDERNDPESLAAWNRAYVDRWSPAEDFRIFWKCAFPGQHAKLDA